MTRKARRRKSRSIVDLFGERFPVARELTHVMRATLTDGFIGVPRELVREILTSPSLGGVFDGERLRDAFGRQILELFASLGPIYGKAGQVALSRLSPKLQGMAETLRLTRLYGQWPPLEFAVVEEILDAEIPEWRTELKVESCPIGVASMAQVHAATDASGREWVIKIIKPDARLRLLETVAALDRVIQQLAPIAVGLVAQRALKELQDLTRGFRGELSLSREREVIERVTEKLRSKRQRLLLIPEVNARFSTDGVLTLERFRGVSLGEIVAGRVTLPAAVRAKLARSMLQELLVQVFELGLFHADPHAGNLILMEDGSVGLFDWGLAGELRDTDRQHIAAILRAVMSVDLEALITVLVEMGEASGVTVSRERVARELRAVVALAKRGKDDPTKKPSLNKLMEAALNGAARLGIPVPDGLLMMAKALITIEGLARGIDPDVSMLRVATPVLWRAARPGLKEFVAMAKRLPGFMRQFTSKAVLLCALAASSALHSGQARALDAFGVGTAGQTFPERSFAVLGDSLATGAGSHPNLAFDPVQMWKVFEGEVDVRALDDSGEVLPAPLRLWPSTRDYRSPVEWAFRQLVHALSRSFLDTEEYGWGYQLGRRRGFAPGEIVIAAENGARIRDATRQIDRLLDAAVAAARVDSEGRPILPDEIAIFFTGNDLCGPTIDFTTPPETYEAELIEALRYLLRNGVPPAGGTTILLPGFIGMLQLINAPAIQAKTISAFGRSETCASLRERSFLPPPGWTPEGLPTEARWFGNVIPPNPQRLCPTLFGARSGKDEDREAPLANRIRAYREAVERVAGVMETFRSEKFRDAKIRFVPLAASTRVEFGDGDIAGDCFHLSRQGHSRLADALVSEAAGKSP